LPSFDERLHALGGILAGEKFGYSWAQSLDRGRLALCARQVR
jgi:hypothetical protein